MSAIAYWIQRADFSSTDYAPVEVAEGLRAFETHDWRRELDLYSELETAGVECCPPGIGFMAPGGETLPSGEILHICPNETGDAMVHYHFTAPRTLLGLISVPRSIVETRMSIQRSVVLELIRFFFEGRHDWMVEKLGSAQPR